MGPGSGACADADLRRSAAALPDAVDREAAAFTGAGAASTAGSLTAVSGVVGASVAGGATVAAAALADLLAAGFLVETLGIKIMVNR